MTKNSTMIHRILSSSSNPKCVAKSFLVRACLLLVRPCFPLKLAEHANISFHQQKQCFCSTTESLVVAGNNVSRVAIGNLVETSKKHVRHKLFLNACFLKLIDPPPYVQRTNHFITVSSFPSSIT